MNVGDRFLHSFILDTQTHANRVQFTRSQLNRAILYQLFLIFPRFPTSRNKIENGKNRVENFRNETIGDIHRGSFV